MEEKIQQPYETTLNTRSKLILLKANVIGIQICYIKKHFQKVIRTNNVDLVIHMLMLDSFSK